MSVGSPKEIVSEQDRLRYERAACLVILAGLCKRDEIVCLGC